MALGTAAGEAWSSGFGRGVDAYEAATKRKLIMQKLADDQIDQASTLIEQQLKAADELAAKVGTRDKNYEMTMQGIKAQIDDTLAGIGAIKTEKAQMTYNGVRQLVNAQWPMIDMTASERASREIANKKASAEAQYDAAYGGAPSAANIGAPAPQAAPAPAPTLGVPQPDMGMGVPPDAQMQVAQQPAAPAPMRTGPASPDQMDPRDIEALIANPGMVDVFDQQYGPGSGKGLLEDAPEPGTTMSKDEFVQRQLMGGETELQKKMAAKKADAWEASKTSSREARMILRSNFAQRNLLDDGIITGAGADWRTTLQSYQQWLSGKPDPELSRTQLFKFEAGAKAGKLIKQFGAGTGLSDADLKFAMMLALGDNSMTEDAIRAGLDASTKAATWTMFNPSQNPAEGWSQTRTRIIQNGILTPEQLNEFETLFGR